MADIRKENQLPQEEKEKELVKARDEGRRLGVMALCAVAAVIMAVSVIKGKRDNYEIMALLLSYVCASSIPQFRATRSKSYLLAAVICGLAAAACLGGYLYMAFR